MTFAAKVWLDSARVSLRAGPRGLTLVHEGRETHELIPVRAFPESAPEGVIALCGPHGVVASLEDARALDPASRAALEEALAAQVFAPEILAVEALSFEDGGYLWRVRTTAGPRRFRVRQSWSALPVARSGAGVVVHADDGVRYRIPVLERLDAASLRLLFPLL